MKKIFIMFIAAFIYTQQAFAQVNKGDDAMSKMLDSSRPGQMHQVLKRLVGTWKFQDKNLTFVRGTLVRSTRYDDRFFDVEITGGKLKLPVAEGMKENNYKSFQIEGYDNVMKAFITISINNHIGSDIHEQTGRYDP